LNCQPNCLQNSNMTQKQIQILDTMRRLWVELATWTRAFLVSTASNLSDLGSVTKRLLRVPDDFSSVLQPFYGVENAMKFDKLLTEHIYITTQAISAQRLGNTETVKILREKWYKNADDLANFLGGINPCWDSEAWRKTLHEYLAMTEEEAMDILSGQNFNSIVHYDSIQESAINMGGEMGCGIIGQFEL